MDSMRIASGRMYGEGDVVINIADALHSLAGATDDVTITNVDINGTGEGMAMIGCCTRGMALPQNPIAGRSKVMVKHLVDGETVSLIAADTFDNEYPLTDNFDYSFPMNPNDTAKLHAISTGATTINVLEQS